MIYITVDIETIPGPVAPDLNSIKAPANYKKEEAIQAYREANQESLHSKQALNSLEGQIICIGYKIECALQDFETITGIAYGNDEAKIIEDFYKVVDGALDNFPFGTTITWVGHNLMEFDAPFIYHKALKYNSNLRIVLPKSSRECFDTMKKWAPTDYKRKTSLKKIATFLGIDQSGTDGSMVWDMYKAGKIEEINKYCLEDVEITNKVFKILG